MVGTNKEVKTYIDAADPFVYDILKLRQPLFQPLNELYTVSSYAYAL